jgi:hypothetical protein
MPLGKPGKAKAGRGQPEDLPESFNGLPAVVRGLTIHRGKRRDKTVPFVVISDDEGDFSFPATSPSSKEEP